jgi:cytochrome c553
MRVLLLLLAALTCASCVDPVHSDAIAALGEEKSGERPGPFHRAGQPCLTCHTDRGPGAPEFSVAGTIYATRTGTDGLAGVQVTLLDANNVSHVAQTNRVGNFYVPKSEWDPTFPVFVRLDLGDKKKIMQTRIGAQGSCAFCHNGPRPGGNGAKMAPVFLEDR